ncbi:hypothetical protein GO755_30650 [Spirosoma sp. HMF4905]|uniref:Uncharacterized protein n=1 Tax=Spirosoma arboris TaxID=2682092 RepID=A0A7K1SKU3_9BACT|nr:hypothetical protein [Spirosoma arboris]MVM34431.1 hypothetical protein [Spirosoma arboris]
MLDKDTLATVLSDLANGLSHQHAIYHLLTKDLPTVERQKIELLRQKDYYLIMQNFVQLSNQDDPSFEAANLLKTELAAIEVKLKALE